VSRRARKYLSNSASASASTSLLPNRDAYAVAHGCIGRRESPDRRNSVTLP
jgi:hypothetical protein